MPQTPKNQEISWQISTETDEEFPRLPIIPKTEFYGRIPLDLAFDVPAILQLASEKKQLPYGTTLYLVDFASRANIQSDYGLLAKLDKAAHREAAESEGFLLYFRGDLDPAGYTRSFCVWENMAFAKRAAAKPAHRAAARIADSAYEYYRVTMREARLAPTSVGYEFGQEMSHTVGQSTAYSLLASAAISGSRLSSQQAPQDP